MPGNKLLNEKALTSARGTRQFLSPKSTIKLGKLDEYMDFSWWLTLAHVSNTCKNFTQFSASEQCPTWGRENRKQEFEGSLAE